MSAHAGSGGFRKTLAVFVPGPGARSGAKAIHERSSRATLRERNGLENRDLHHAERRIPIPVCRTVLQSDSRNGGVG